MKSLLISFLAGILALGKPERITNVSIQKTPEALSETRIRLRGIYTAELNVREATGHNDGKQVEAYLRYAGLKRGDPWCASFVCWALGQAGIPNPRSGWCPDLFPASKVIWQRPPSTRNPEPSPHPEPTTGDVFGLFFPDKGRIAHVGFIDQWGDKYIVSVEGNTNEAGSREGDGVYCKRRLISSIYKVAHYCGTNL